MTIKVVTVLACGICIASSAHAQVVPDVSVREGVTIQTPAASAASDVVGTDTAETQATIPVREIGSVQVAPAIEAATDVIDVIKPRCGDGILQADEECSVSGAKGSDPTEVIQTGSPTVRIPTYKECPVGYDCAECTCSLYTPLISGEVVKPVIPERIVVLCGNGVIDEGEECGELDASGAEIVCSEPGMGCVDCKCVSLCGNGTFERDSEECDFAESSVEIFKACNLSKATSNVPYVCTNDCTCSLCGNGTFNKDSEECDYATSSTEIFKSCNLSKKTTNIPYACTNDCACISCGNGVVDADSGEQCELDAQGAMTDDSQCKTDELCVDCTCYEKPGGICHDGKLDSGEECDSDGTVADGTWASPIEEQASADQKCPEGEKCLFNCTCAVEGPPLSEEPVPVAKTCSVKISGASSEGAKEYVDKLNARVHEILGTDTVDVFGEIGYSVAYVTISFADTAAPASAAMSSGSKIVIDDAKMGAWALVQIGGTPPYDYGSERFKPALAAIKQPIIIFPVGAEPAGQEVAKALGMKDVVYPNLSAVAGLESVTLSDVVGVLGSDNVTFTVASPTAMEVNNFVRWEVKPTITTSKATGDVVGGTLQEGEFRMPWDWPNFTAVEGFEIPEGMKIEDMYIENRQLDVNLVLEELATRAAEWKAAGREISCDIAADLPYEANLNMQYLAVQNKVVESGGIDTQGFAGLAVMTEMARGGGCGGRCDMAVSVPPSGDLIVLAGMAAAGLAGILAVRRRRR